MEDPKDLILRQQEAKNSDQIVEVKVTQEQINDFGVTLSGTYVEVIGQRSEIIGDIGTPEVPDERVYFGPDVTYISLKDDGQKPNMYLILTLRFKDGSTKKYHLSRNLENLIEEIK